MQHLKHCIVLSFFGSTHKLAFWAKPGYVYTYICTGVHAHIDYKLDTTSLQTCTRNYWQENNIHRYGI